MKLTRDPFFKAFRIILLSLALGVAIGYFSFYVTMPSVVVPATINPDLPVIGVIMFGIGLLVGLLSENLESITVEILLGTVIGPIFAWLLFISPSFIPDVILPDASGYIYNILHSALPVIIVSLIVLFVSGFIGTSLMEDLMTKAAPSPFAEPEMVAPGPGQVERKQ